MYSLGSTGLRCYGGRHGQRGAVLLVALIAALLASSSILLTGLERSAVALRAREAAATMQGLANAKRALIGWSVGAGLDGSGTAHTPGVLPFPDRNTDRKGYDRKADCVTRYLSDRHLIGRLAGFGEESPCPTRALGVEFHDGSGEPLWYAVSRNLVHHRGGSGSDLPINPGLLDDPPVYPWLRLIDSHGNVLNGSDGHPLTVAAVIIAPGPALADQTRQVVAPGAAEYLDRITLNGVTYDNADSDGCQDAVTGADRHTDCPGLTGEEFVVHPGIRAAGTTVGGFNDRLIYITAAELLRAAEARALGEMAVVLERYRANHAGYPWMAPYTVDPGIDPMSTVAYHAQVDGAGNTRRGMLPIHTLAGQRYDTGYTLSWTIDAGATITTTDTASLGATPMPSDAELYALVSTPPQTMTRPAMCVWNGDDGIDCSSEPYLHAPGINRVWNGTILQEREVSVAHDEANWVDTTGTGSVAADPTATSLRTRMVTTTMPLPASFAASVRGRNYEIACVGSTCSVTGMSVERTLTVDADTIATFTFTGLEYDLSVARDGIPPWFVENGWYRYIFAAVSSEEVGAIGSAPGRCIRSASGCLTLSASGAMRNDVPALLIGAGPALSGQIRAGCGGACFTEYFESSGNAIDDDSAIRAAQSTYFNDQIRVVGPRGIIP